MLKTVSIFAVLLALAIYSMSAMAAPPARACNRLLSIDDISYVAINDFLTSKRIKNELMDQSIQSPKMKNIILEYSDLVDRLYLEHFDRILQGTSPNIPHQALGFKSISELRTLKEQVLKAHFELLARIDPELVSEKFKKELFDFTERVYHSEVTKYELPLMETSIETTLQFYSRM